MAHANRQRSGNDNLEIDIKAIRKRYFAPSIGRKVARAKRTISGIESEKRPEIAFSILLEVVGGGTSLCVCGILFANY